MNDDFPEIAEMRHAIRLTLHGINGSSRTRAIATQELTVMDENGLRYLTDMIHTEWQRRSQLEKD